MNFKKVIILFGFFIVLMATVQIVFAQEAVAPVDPVALTSNQQSPAQKESDLQWAWGEVTNLDNQTNTVTLKYLDYETDQEKDLVLVVDEKTTFENIKDFNELKLNDTLSIDYLIEIDNRNIAKNICFEKPDSSSADSVLPETAVSDLAQPIAQSEMPVDSSITANEVLTPVEPALVLEEPALVLEEPALVSVEPALVLEEPALVSEEPASEDQIE